MPAPVVALCHLFARVRTIAARGLPKTDEHPEIKPMPSLIGKPDPDRPAPEGQKLLALNDQDLRDTAVTWLANAGRSIPEICSITGHSMKRAHHILKHYLAMNPELADSTSGKLIAWYDVAEERGERAMKLRFFGPSWAFGYLSAYTVNGGISPWWLLAAPLLLIDISSLR